MTDDPRILVMRVPSTDYVLVAYVYRPDNASPYINLYTSYLEMDRTKDRFLFRLDKNYAAPDWTFAQNNTLLGPVIFDELHFAPCPWMLADALALAKHAVNWFSVDFSVSVAYLGPVTLTRLDGKLIGAQVSEQRGPNL
jgi:hypothetical protein